MLALLLFCSLFLRVPPLRGELWKEDLSSAMKIGLSTTGYKSVDLRCDSDRFSVNVTLEADFRGVVYTRGSFDDKKPPCFKRHDQGTLREGDVLFIALSISFHKCRTLMDVAESRYTNTLVVQHDSELIMPGDAAFRLDCAFVPEFKARTPAPPQPGLSFKSKITLVDADPSEKGPSSGGNVAVLSDTENVSFIPRARDAKDEL